MAENEVVLKQRNGYGVDTQVKLVDGRELQILNKGKKINQSYSVDILSLADKSEKSIYVAWKWLIASISFVFVMLLLLNFLPQFLSTNINLYLDIVMLIGLLGCIICLINFWKGTSTKQIFFSRNAHIPIITLRSEKPTKQTFLSFVNVIEKRIEKFRSHMDIPEDKQSTGEIKMLRRLSERGVITKKTYEKAKSKLMSGFSNNGI